MIWANIGYGPALEKVRGLTDEQWTRFTELWPTAKKHTGLRSDFWPDSEDQRITIEEAEALEKELGVLVEVKGWGGTMITKMQDRAEWDSRTPTAGDIVAGRAVQIAIPDLGLLQIDEVTWEDDCCTRQLQDFLDDGWRILAVCPPNAQRRPDYILGRRKR